MRWLRPKAIAAAIAGFDGADTSAAKHCVYGTHRTRTPEDTLSLLAPRLTSLGITRIATITGLDRIGVPVVLATRPNSRSLAVSQGKGLSLAAARVSAIMESIESHFAEQNAMPVRYASERELADSVALVDTVRLARSAERNYTPAAQILWVEGRDLFSADCRWLPYECVHTDFRLPRPPGHGYFPGNSNGLASGNHPLEAMSHALAEVIERDALSLWHLHGLHRLHAVDTASVDDPACLEVLSQLEQAAIRVRIWDITSDIGVACFHCLLLGDDDVDPEFGTGCHPRRGIALLRALTEAIQARTTFIAGSRDDFGQALYRPYARAVRHRMARRLMAQPVSRRPFNGVPDVDRPSCAEDVDWMLGQLSQAGIDEALWVALGAQDLGIAVGRMVVPGLEGAGGGTADYVPGLRAGQLGA